MNTHTPADNERVAAATPSCTPITPLLDHGTEDGMSSDMTTANKLTAEQQLNRFLQWLQLTDRGHQPC